MSVRSLLLGAILAAATAGGAARAQGREPHGVFLRFLVGPAGFTGTATFYQGSLPPGSFAYRGLGGGFAFAVGSALSRSLVFYGQVFYDLAGGSTMWSSGPGGDGVFGRFDAIGPGMTYYFPSHLYLGASFDIAELAVGQPAQHPGGSVGWGGSATIGKEWSVSDRWAVGLAGQIFVGGNTTGNWSLTEDHVPPPPPWTAGGAMLAFSASYD